jgi:hypothetical protein
MLSAPGQRCSTIRIWCRLAGSFLRSLTFGHVRQPDAVASRLLSGLVRRAPLFTGADELVSVDVDDTPVAVRGYAKQGSGYSYSGVRGLNAETSEDETLQLIRRSRVTIAPNREDRLSLGHGRPSSRILYPRFLLSSSDLATNPRNSSMTGGRTIFRTTACTKNQGAASGLYEPLQQQSER